MGELNQNIFLFINSFAGKNHFLDLFMISAAKITPYFFIFVLVYLWIKNKKQEALFAGYAATLGVIISKSIGFIYFHPRPFAENLGVKLIEHKADSSFPSDHTTFVISIALMLLALKSTRKLAIFLTFLALFCGISRVYVGVHYPFDILGGIIVGSFSTLIIYFFKNKLQKINNFIIDKISLKKDN